MRNNEEEKNIYIYNITSKTRSQYIVVALNFVLYDNQHLFHYLYNMHSLPQRLKVNEQIKIDEQKRMFSIFYPKCLRGTSEYSTGKGGGRDGRQLGGVGRREGVEGREGGEGRGSSDPCPFHLQPPAFSPPPPPPSPLYTGWAIKQSTNKQVHTQEKYKNLNFSCTL